ncbi:MAG: cytochrome c maturation protein CcmE [Bacillota bacterium]|nr:cytochrome c maturation protein CcmE [Clostridia bacterium]
MAAKKKIIIGTVIILCAVFYLVISGFSNVKVHVQLEDLVNSGEEYRDTYVQTEGAVLGDSIRWDAPKVELTFKIAGKLNPAVTMPVVYKKTIPENFQDATDVLIGGYYDPDGVFLAEEMITKCPSKYESKEE